MKLLNTLFGAALLAVLASCGTATKTTSADSTNVDSMNNASMMSTSDSGVTTTTTTVVPGSYRNLKTGKTVYIVRDPQTGYAYDSISKVPVEFYINDNNDTLYQTGAIVNNSLIKTGDGTWKLDDTKMKVDGDKVKVKTDSTKIKINGDKSKEKAGDYKKKVNGDEVKEKTATTKSKTENGVTTTKPRN